MDPTAPPVPSLSLEEPQGGTELALQHPSVAAAANVTAAAVMAEAGSSLQGVEAEVVLLPLRQHSAGVMAARCRCQRAAVAAHGPQALWVGG